MSRLHSILLWIEDDAMRPQPVAIANTIQVLADGTLAADGGSTQGSAVLIQPISPDDGVVAVAHVTPRTTYGLVAVNRIAVAPGLHPLRHADRLDIADRRFWISAEFAPQRTQYVPASHGADVRCYLTKAKLREGQDIVICPGFAGTRCGVIYTTQAWDAVIQQNPQMKCPNCGYRPTESAWQPPPATSHREILHGLCKLIEPR
jgi:hypothetical protein